MQNTIENLPTGTKIIFFDGVCNLCDNFVQLIIKNDSKRVFRFASLQSSFTQEYLSEQGISTQDLDSIILFEPNKAYYIKSTAALSILKELNTTYKFFYVFKILPKKLRDLIYDFVAKNRYKWMGKKDSCMVPSPEIKELFIDF